MPGRSQLQNIPRETQATPLAKCVAHNLLIATKLVNESWRYRNLLLASQGVEG